MVMRVGGLVSGMDIDALVEKLMQAERVPLDKMSQKKQVFEWQRDAYRSVNTKLKTFDTFLFDKMIMSGKMNQKTATSSNSDLVSVKATPGASGHISINGVSQLASSAQAVGTQTTASGNSKLVDLGITDTSIELKSIGADGRLAEKATKISFDPNTETVDQLVKKINNSGAGVTAIFEGGKLSISAKNTGSEKSGQGEIIATSGIDVFDKLGFTGTDGKLASNGKNAMFEVNGIQTERSSNTFTLSGYQMTLKKTFNEGTVADAQVIAATTELQNAIDNLATHTNLYQTALQTYQDGDYENKFNLAYNNQFSKPNLNDTEKSIYKDIKNKDALSKLTDEDITALSTNSVEELKELDAFKGFSTEDLNILKDNMGSVEKFRDTALVEAEEKIYKANKNVLMNDDAVSFLKTMDGKNKEEIKEAIDNLSDGETKKILKSANLDQLKSLADSGKVEDYNSLVKKEQEFVTEKTKFENIEKDFKAAEQRKGDAEQALKNAEAAKAAAGGTSTVTANPVTMSATSDTAAAIEQITEFVDKYNEMIEEFNNQLKETKYRDFPPLTAEQRKDMSESEQKLWDEKSKSGLLKNDQILREGMGKMRMSLMSPVDGVSDEMLNTLAKIGITTSDKLSDGGKLVIDKSKLEKALEKDPDQVFNLFSSIGEKDENGKYIENTRGIAYRLKDAMQDMTKKIERKAGNEGSVSHSSSLGKQINDADERIKILQAKMKDIEARYWKQFTAMETAIQKANEQAGMFAQFGQ